MIVASILDAAPLSLRFTFSVIFQDSQPHSRVDITEAWNRRSLRLFDTLDAVKMYLRFLKRDHPSPLGDMSEKEQELLDKGGKAKAQNTLFRAGCPVVEIRNHFYFLYVFTWNISH